MEESDLTEERNERVSDVVSTLENHSELIRDNKISIRKSFDSVVDESFASVNTGEAYQNLEVVLGHAVEDDDELEDLKDSILSPVLNYDATFRDEFESQGLTEISEFFHEMYLDYHIPFQREISRMNEGQNYWNNISSTIGYRAEEPYIEHELLVDYEEIIEFSGGIQSTIIMISHLTGQLSDVPDKLGRSTLDNMNKEMLESTVEDIEDLIERVSEYQEENDSSGDESEDVDSVKTE